MKRALQGVSDVEPLTLVVETDANERRAVLTSDSRSDAWLREQERERRRRKRWKLKAHDPTHADWEHHLRQDIIEGTYDPKRNKENKVISNVATPPTAVQRIATQLQRVMEEMGWDDATHHTESTLYTSDQKTGGKGETATLQYECEEQSWTFEASDQ